MSASNWGSGSIEIRRASGAYSTVDPSAFEMPDAPANEAAVFLFSSEFRRKSAYGTKPT